MFAGSLYREPAGLLRVTLLTMPLQISRQCQPFVFGRSSSQRTLFLAPIYSFPFKHFKRKAHTNAPMHLQRFFFCNQTRFFSASTTAIVSNRVSLYLQRAKLIDSIRLALRSDSIRSLPPLLNDPALDSFVVTHALRSAPSPDSALSFADTLKCIPTFSHTHTTLHAIAKILAKSKRSDELQSLIDDINGGSFTNVSRVGFMDILKWNSIVGDLDSAVRVWNEYRLVLPQGKKHPCTESYNLLMSLYAQKGKNLEAVEMFGQMIKEGVNPNSRSYTVLIEHLVCFGRLEAALEVFDKMPLMRIKRTLKLYSILTEGFTKVERFDVVKKLLKEMKTDGILPGNAMRVSLNCLRDAGFVEETEEFVRELLPDERVRSIGFTVNDSEEENEFEDEDDSEVSGGGVQLKPWLDPSALASALSDWNPDEVSALEEAKFVWTTRLVCKLLRGFKKAETAWKFFCWVAYQPGEFTHDVYTVSRMLSILAYHGHVELGDQLISKVKREGIKLSFSSVRLIIDFYGISKKADAALKVFGEVKSIAGPISESNLMLLYSSLSRTLVKCKRGLDAVDLLEEMILSGILPDIQTFTGLMQYFALEGDLRMVQKLFGMVRQSGLEPDAYMFRILIRAYCKNERSVLAMRLFEDMRNLNLLPDTATKALLVKSLWKEGKLREAAAVEEKSEESNEKLPLASSGHVWTVNAADLTTVYKIYSNSFATNGE